MKKRKCRMSVQEQTQHDTAVKVRKMTDAQLCEFLDSLTSPETAEPTASFTVADFIQQLDALSGTGNGIGKATIYKLKKFAEKEGYLGA